MIWLSSNLKWKEEKTLKLGKDYFWNTSCHFSSESNCEKLKMSQCSDTVGYGFAAAVFLP